MKSRKLSKNKRIILVLIPSAIVIMITGYLMYPESPKDASDTARFAYCRKCDKEFGHVPGKDLTPCPLCGREMVGLTESIKKTGKPRNPYLPVLMAWCSEAILIMGIFYYVTKPSSSPVEEQEDFLTMRCPNCQRKLKYRESQQGNLGQCPLCKKPLMFPRLTVAEPGQQYSESRAAQG